MGLSKSLMTSAYEFARGFTTLKAAIHYCKSKSNSTSSCCGRISGVTVVACLATMLEIIHSSHHRRSKLSQLRKDLVQMSLGCVIVSERKGDDSTAV